MGRMSKKGTIEVFQTKISRNDRFAQMSHQEKLIEQKKREIQAKLEQRRTTGKDSDSTKITHKTLTIHKSHTKTVDKAFADKQAFNFNTFSNDGSFLNQFKQLKEKKLDHKIKFSSKQGSERDCERNERNKKWKKDNSSSPPSKELNRGTNLNVKLKQSRFAVEKVLPSVEPKLINPNYNFLNQPRLQTQQPFEPAGVTAQDVTGQPLLKNLVTPPPPPPPHVPIMLSVPPPQLQLMAPELAVEMCPPSTVITTVALPASETTMITVPPPCLPPPSMELTNIPPPNSLQIHNIPQPEPINTLTIPPPAPLQVQNIPPPSPIQLNEIPNPKPLDLLNIPTPNEEPNADFIKNVPPPNKSVPPPTHPLAVPPGDTGQVLPTCIPPPNIMPPTSMPPPPTTATSLNLLVAHVPPVQQVQLQQIPPATIPSLMTQPIMPLPPTASATMGIVPPPQINVPPPTLMQPAQMQIPPPIYNPPTIIPVNVPPPQIGIQKDMNIPGCAGDYEAMASLGRMVAQCGPGIEDVVRQRKIQDPSLWFLYDKNSSAYRQYQQLVEQFKAEMSAIGDVGPSASEQQPSQRSDAEDYKPEEIYESDVGYDDSDMNPVSDGASDLNLTSVFANNKRKRKSRWGDKVSIAAPPTSAIVQSTIPAPILPPSSTGVMLSKITRQDAGFLAYVRSTYGGANLNEETWKKAEDNYKVHLVYQEMLKKKQDFERLQRAGRNKYEYDSDEETEGGTWEHKLREKEMQTTQSWAQDLTRQADGKHHIGDFLPPEEFRKLLSKTSGDVIGDASDYSDHKLGEDNKGFKMLQKLGWSEGKGLGSTEKGILEPINKGFVSRDGQGLGNQTDGNDGNGDGEDEYDAYRKRMMLAYKFRPNPLNNPRRAYY